MAQSRHFLIPSFLTPAGALAALLACSSEGDLGSAEGDGDGDGGLPTAGDGDMVGDGDFAGDGDQIVGGDGDGVLPGDGDAAGMETGEIAVSLYNVETGQLDERDLGHPGTMSTVELLPRTTLVGTGPDRTQSFTFSIDGETRVDTVAPFYMNEVAGEPSEWVAAPGTYAIDYAAYGSPDATGEPLASGTFNIEITSAGTDTTPESGEHSRHDMWVGADGAYNTTGGDFAFMVLLPEGYDPAVKYPMITFLHHGSGDYRGTDNNGLPLTNAPLLSGDRSIVSSATRHQYPAIVLVPQLPEVIQIDGVNHEWASFYSLSNATGDYEATPNPSIAGAHVIKMVRDTLSGALTVNGAPLSVDESRHYITGHSMGGFGTWDLIQHEPDLWSAAIPMAGYHDQQSASKLVDLPIWCFHHEIDSYNPFYVDTMLGLIEAVGGTKMKLTRLTFDTGGAGDQAHFRTPGAAWNDEPGLFEWIFSQTK